MSASNVYSFIEELSIFEYKLSCRDHVWNVIFCDSKNKWHHVTVVKYNETCYIFDIMSRLHNLEVVLNHHVREASSFGGKAYDVTNNVPLVWNIIMVDGIKWLKFVGKNWIKANQQIYKLYPFKYRKGIVANSVVRASLSDLHRIDQELGIKKMNKFIGLVEDGYFNQDKNYTLESMTANDFFNYCKVAYIHGKRKDDDVDKILSGREMYERYADGRDEGLLKINPDSKTEFADWIDDKHPEKTRGGHPWEIKRGGNTTHIDLYVSRPRYRKEGFEITLRAGDITRLKEALCMFIGIHANKLPITIDGAEAIRKRLLAQDNVGIVPSFNSLNRANQDFHNHQDVYDVLYYDDLGRYKRRITPLISWEPLPILKPLS